MIIGEESVEDWADDDVLSEHFGGLFAVDTRIDVFL